MPLTVLNPARLALLALLGAFPSLAVAQAIDLSKPMGNATGCVKKDQRGSDEDDNFYLTQTSLDTARSTCSFIQTLTAPDGTLVITALCTIEGEEGRSINPISITRSAGNPAALRVFDEYGALLDEVTPCP